MLTLHPPTPDELYGLEVNGSSLRCLLDSGASGLILNSAEARRLGITMGRPSGLLRTAGGSRPATQVNLAHMVLAGHHLEGMDAVVVGGTDTSCLLGQDILSRLGTVELHGDQMTLR